MMSKARSVAALLPLALAFFAACGAPRRVLAPPAQPPPPAAQPEPEEPSPPPEAPPKPAPSPAPKRRPPPRNAREDLARTLAARGDLAGALTQWKILRTLEPENEEHARRVKETRGRIAAALAERMAAAQLAFERGDRDAARSELLRALALDPANEELLERLREIEREHLETLALNKAARWSRKGVKETNRPASPPKAPGNEAALYLEVGVELVRQGDYEGGVVEIGKYLKAYPDDKRARKLLSDAHLQWGGKALKEGDPAEALRQFEESRKLSGTESPRLGREIRRAKRQWADELYEKGARASRTDLPRAIELWKQCLSLDPDHIQAKLQLEKALRVQEKLRQLR